jgi:hypothetical protein
VSDPLSSKETGGPGASCMVIMHVTGTKQPAVISGHVGQLEQRAELKNKYITKSMVFDASP